MKLFNYKITLSKLVKKFIIGKHIYIPVIIASFIFLYFSYHALLGNKGVVKYFQLRQELQQKSLIEKNLYNKVQDKQNLVDGMNSKSLDIDLLDEQARKKLGYANKNEVIIYESDNNFLKK